MPIQANKTIQTHNMATAAQKKNIARFKAVQAEAKKLKSKNKSLSHIQAVKQAWAILYSKDKKVDPKKAAKKVRVIKKKASVKKAAVKKAAPKKLKYVGVKKTASGASRYEYKIAGMNNFKKSKETQFYEILKDNKLMFSNFSIYGKTYTKLFANVKTIVSTGEKLIAPIVKDLYKKIENLPLKISVKPIGKKSKHYEYIDGKNQETIHQWTEYKLSL